MVKFRDMKRPPIVVVVGHVDHGKTSLLDYIRKANVAAKEAGKITQSIGAYEIEHSPSPEASAERRKITFIDTPGHQAFSQMRIRGVKIADIAILVVAVDDSVQEQTREAIKVLEQTGTPFVVAITKLDKVNADINKVKNDLMQAQVLLEGYGGNISWQGVSSKTGEGINELLDLILLTAELEDLQYQPESPGRGFILESRVDSRKGAIATVIVTDGKLKVGDEICAASPQAGGLMRVKIKSLENFLGKPVKEAAPSSPVLIIGFKEAPPVGAELLVGGEILTTSPITPLQTQGPAVPVKSKEGLVIINLILKADTRGSLEALSAITRNLPLSPGYEVNIIDESIGEITDGDVKWASAGAEEAVIVGFRSKPSKAAADLAKIQNIKIIASDIIYELTKQLEDWIKNFGRKVISGDLEILAIFGKGGGREQTVGGKVAAGEVKNNAIFEIQRNGKEIGVGRIVNLQQQRKDTTKVEAGNECGLLAQSEMEIKIGDHLIFN